jgi:hypothetical protein
MPERKMEGREERQKIRGREKKIFGQATIFLNTNVLCFYPSC